MLATGTVPVGVVVVELLGVVPGLQPARTASAVVNKNDNENLAIF